MIVFCAINTVHSMQVIALAEKETFTWNEYEELQKLRVDLRRTWSKNSQISSVKVQLSDEEFNKRTSLLQQQITRNSYLKYGVYGILSGIGIYTLVKLATHHDVIGTELITSGLVGGSIGILAKHCDTDALPPKVNVPRCQHLLVVPEDKE